MNIFFFAFSTISSATNTWKQCDEQLKPTIVNLALHSLIFTSRISKTLPFIERTSLTLLNFKGLDSLKFLATEISKQYSDLKDAYHMPSRLMLVAIAAKVSITACSIFFICSHSIASSTTLMGYTSIGMRIYSVTKPIGLLALAVQIALDIFEHYKSNALLTSLKKTDRITESEKMTALWLVDSYSAASVKQLTNPNRDTYIQILENKLTIDRLSALLNIYGYVAMSFQKMYPRTALDSGISIATNLLYLALTFKKIQADKAIQK